MPTFYNYTQDGLIYSFDDVFVPADAFREGNLWVWGNNFYGLGDNTAITRSTPVTTFAGGTNWKQVSVGSQQIAATKSDGTLWTWGYGTYGQLGGNTTGTKRTPVTTFAGGTNWKQVSSDSTSKHCAAIKTDGTLWTWGKGTYGQLGVNDPTSKNTPVTTFAGGTNWKQVSTGYNMSAAIKTDGTLWTWGKNAYGQLGDNTIITRSTPVTTFAGGTNWKQVSTGYAHCAAIKTDGTLWTWGRGRDGQLGDNTTTNNIRTPVTTFAGGTNWKQLSCGSNHIAAIKTDGTLWTWGYGTYGLLGDNRTITRSTPVTTFAGGTNWKQVSAGRNFCAALTFIDPTFPS
jgi:alpha-tubulin suppressor-like RCC1 family protein